MNRLIHIAVVALGLGAAPAFGAAQAPAENTAAVVREANELVYKKRFREAAAKLAPLVPEAAGDASFSTLYGRALLESGRAREAIPAFRRALAVQPDLAIARVHLGRALAATGDLDGARREIALVRDRKDLPEDVRRIMVGNVAALDEGLAQRAEVERQRRLNPPIGPQPSADETKAIYASAQFVRDKRPAEATARLDPLAGRLAGNPDFDYVHGVAMLDAGRPAEAAVSLRRALAAKPGLHVARAELARAFVAMGDLPAARREFEAVRGTASLSTTIRDAVGRQIVTIDELVAARRKMRVVGYIEGGGGFDTNVNGGPSASTLLIPALAFLGPATINPRARPKSSAFGEFSAGVGVAQPLDNDFTLFFNTTGTGRLLAQHSEFQTGVGGGEAGISKRIDNWGRFSIAAVGQTFGIDENIYRNIAGLAGLWQNRLADTWDTTVAASWLRLDYPEIYGLDANRYTLTTSIGRRFDVPLSPVVSVSVNGGKEETTNDVTDFHSFGFLGARLNVEATLAPWLLVFGQAGVEMRKYDSDFPLFFRRRADDFVQLLGGLEIRLSDSVRLRPSVSWIRTVSNVDLYDTSRTISSLAVRWQF